MFVGEDGRLLAHAHGMGGPVIVPAEERGDDDPVDDLRQPQPDQRDQDPQAPEEAEELRYRGRGWPGMTTVKVKGSNGETRQMSYEESWGDILSKNVQLRCRLLALLADSL